MNTYVQFQQYPSIITLFFIYFALLCRNSQKLLYLCTMKTALFGIIFVVALICGYSDAWKGIFDVMKPRNTIDIDSIRCKSKPDSSFFNLQLKAKDSTQPWQFKIK